LPSATHFRLAVIELSTGRSLQSPVTAILAVIELSTGTSPESPVTAILAVIELSTGTSPESPVTAILAVIETRLPTLNTKRDALPTPPPTPPTYPPSHTITPTHQHKPRCATNRPTRPRNVSSLADNQPCLLQPIQMTGNRPLTLTSTPCQRRHRRKTRISLVRMISQRQQHKSRTRGKPRNLKRPIHRPVTHPTPSHPTASPNVPAVRGDGTCGKPQPPLQGGRDPCVVAGAGFEPAASGL